ncbi:MAG: hypothetical protein ACRDI2_05340, partial [Chloroflexota bacterium]
MMARDEMMYMALGEVMALSEIEARFDSEWVLLESPATNEWEEVQSGRVLWHSRDRDEVYRKAKELRPADWAVVYTGELPADAVVV